MRFRYIFAMLSVLSVLGCMPIVNAPPAENLVVVEVTPAMQRAIQDTVKQQLKDPNSALFSGIKTYKKIDGSIEVCGYVNAKNSFGGYSGIAPFYTLLSQVGSSDNVDYIGAGAVIAKPGQESLFFRMFVMC